MRYVRAPEPVVFPEELQLAKGKSHFVVRTFLFRLLRFALGSTHRLGSDQFLYWNASNKERWLAPDAVVRLNVPDSQFDSWTTRSVAERGAPLGPYSRANGSKSLL